MQTIVITFLASFLIYFLWLGSFLLSWLKTEISKRDAVLASLSAVLAALAAEVCKQLLPFVPRPFHLNGLSPLTLTVPFDASFPSNHAAFVFALAAFLWLRSKKIGLIYFLAAILVGAARVSSQVHYPLDILGGAILGVFIALLIDFVASKFSGGHSGERTRPEW